MVTFYCQNDLTSEFMDFKLVEKRSFSWDFWTSSSIYNFLICRLAAILDLYVNGYLYFRNNLTNEFLDLKLENKQVLAEIFGQIVQYIIFKYVFWRSFWIMLVAELCPAGQMSTLFIYIGDWSLCMKPLRNLWYIKMYTGLWSRDRTIRFGKSLAQIMNHCLLIPYGLTT